MDSTSPATAALCELLATRHSCRGFRPDPVPRADIDTILLLAQRTASWCNSQAWQVLVTGPAATVRLRNELLEHVASRPADPDFVWPSYQGIYQDRRRECGLQLYQATGVARGDKPAAERQTLENFRFFGAPHIALITSDAALGVYGLVDCGAYVSTFALAARSLGVGSIAQAALAAHPTFWRERLGLTPDRKLVCGISFGYEDPAHPANGFRTSRAPIAQAAQWIED